MLLAIDVGNTQTVIGVFGDDADAPLEAAGPVGPVAASGADAARARDRSLARQEGSELPGLKRSWRVTTAANRTADEHALLVRELLGLAGLDVAFDGIVVSSSVPSVTGALRTMVDRWFDAPLVVVEPTTVTGMAVAYDAPGDVGPDRIVDAIAAVDLHGAPAIVVDLGTATTFDAVSAEGAYVGGAIVPGIAISLDALFTHAAALRRVELHAPPHAIGRSTVESIQSGTVFGYASLVDGLCRRIAAELGGSPAVVATGGLAPLVAEHCETLTAHEPWLTLHGLRLVHRRATRP